MAGIAGGQYHEAVDSIELSAVFGHIATSTRPVESMVHKFGSVISDMVSAKIIIDHL